MSIRVILFLTILISTLSCSNDDAVCTPPAGTISAETIAQQNLPPATVAIKGSEHANFTGSWSLVKGNGGSFANAKQSETTFTGTPGQAYTLRWSLSGCNLFYKDIEITIGCPTLQANAGVDQQNTLTTYTLNGNVQEGATGMWTIVSGTGGQFANATNHNTNFTGTAGTTYTLRWTLTNACGQTQFDEVIVSILLKYRIKKIESADGTSSTTFEYKNGKLSKVINEYNGDKTELLYEYASNGQLSKVSNWLFEFIFTYSGNTLVKDEQFAISSGKVLSNTQTYTYTNDKISSYIIDYASVGSNDLKNLYTYGANNELTKSSLEFVNNPGVEIVTRTYTYYNQINLVKHPAEEVDPRLVGRYSNLLIKSMDIEGLNFADEQYTYEFDQLGRINKKTTTFLPSGSTFVEIYTYEISN